MSNHPTPPESRARLAVLGSHGAAARRSRRTRSRTIAAARSRRWGRDHDASL